MRLLIVEPVGGDALLSVPGLIYQTVGDVCIFTVFSELRDRSAGTAMLAKQITSGVREVVQIEWGAKPAMVVPDVDEMQDPEHWFLEYPRMLEQRGALYAAVGALKWRRGYVVVVPAGILMPHNAAVSCVLTPLADLVYTEVPYCYRNKLRPAISRLRELHRPYTSWLAPASKPRHMLRKRDLQGCYPTAMGLFRTARQNHRDLLWSTSVIGDVVCETLDFEQLLGEEER
jgi:hypothetical protein